SSGSQSPLVSLLTHRRFQMDFINESLGFGDPRRIPLYNESLFQNNFSEFNETDDLFPRSVRITIALVYMIVCTVGLVGNCLVMYVIISGTAF
ncbi:hypothetical protein QTP86_024472, partial [Hemibagrus guttatus]